MKQFNIAAAAALVVLVTTSSAWAQVIFSDDFESYADTAALNAVWPIGVGTGSTTFLDFGPAGSTNTTKTVHHTNRNTRRDRNFTQTLPLPGQPLRVQFDLYDAAAATDAAAGEYNQVLAFSGTTLTQLVSMGKSNLAAVPDPNKYQARVAFGSVNWINLNATRTVGWHTFAAEIFTDRVDFYVDGLFDQSVAMAASSLGAGFSQARIGSGLSARAEEAFYDNYSVALVPEPASAALVGAASLFLIRRHRRG